MTVLLVVFLSKALVAAVCVGFGRATLGTMHGRAWLSHAAMYAMAASHSFDVTLGIPLATELFPTLGGSKPAAAAPAAAAEEEKA